MTSSENAEFRYLLSMNENGTEDIVEELLNYLDFCKNYQNETEEKSRRDISERAQEYIRTNLRLHQTAIYHYLHAVKASPYHGERETSTSSSIDQIIQQEIPKLLDSIIKTETNTDEPYHMYRLFSILNYFKSFIQNEQKHTDIVVPYLNYLKDQGLGKEVCLYLISNDDERMLDALTQHELSTPVNVSCNLEPDKMLKLCFGFHKHWLLEMINDCQLQIQNKNTAVQTNWIMKKLWQLTLIKVINANTESADVPCKLLTNLEALLPIIEYQDSEDCLTLYFNEILREFKLIKFCIDNSNRKMCMLDKIQNHSALSAISQVCNVSHLERFKIKQLLTQNNNYLARLQNNSKSHVKETHPWDIMTYNAFCVLTLTIDIILTSLDPSLDDKSLKDKMGEVKVMISNLHPLKYRLEILQNVFTCLFLRFENFSTEDESTEFNASSLSESSYFESKKCNISELFEQSRGFICKPNLVNELLSIVKESITELHQNVETVNAKNAGSELDNSAADDMRDLEENLKNLENYVTCALWRWQLITTLDVVSSPKVPALNHLYDNCLEDSSEDEDLQTIKRRKSKIRKRRCKSVNENFIRKTGLLKNKAQIQKTLNSNFKTSTLKQETSDFISMMLAPPSCMVALCLEVGDFSKANRILELYELTNTEESLEVGYTEQFLASAAQIRNSCIYSDQRVMSIPDIDKFTSISVVSSAVVSLLESFLSTNRPPYNYQISELSHTYPQLQIYDHNNSTLISIVDMAISAGIDPNVTYGMLNVAENKIQQSKSVAELNDTHSNYISFMRNVIKVIFDVYQNCENSTVNSMGINSILKCDKIPTNFKEYSQQTDSLQKMTNFYLELATSNFSYLSTKIPAEHYKVFMNLINTAGSHVFNTVGIERERKRKSEKTYLKRFYTYYENISNLLLNNKADEDVSEAAAHIDILNLNLHEIIGNLIFKRNIAIEVIEPVCKSIGINLIHKLVLNCCPSIKCKSSESCYASQRLVEFENVLAQYDSVEYESPSDDSLAAGLSMSKPNSEIMTYILVHNWVIANLVKKVHSDLTEHIFQQSLDVRTKYLDNYLQEEKFEVLKDMFDGNKCLTSLQIFYNLELLCNLIEKCLIKKNLTECLLLIDSLPDYQILKSNQLLSLRDRLLLKLSTEPTPLNWTYFLRIQDSTLQADYVLQYLKYWGVYGASEVLLFVCANKDFIAKTSIIQECKDWLKRLPIYQKITKHSPESTWSSVHTLSMEDPENILQILMDAQEFELCLYWTNIHPVSSNIKKLITYSYLRQWFSSEREDEEVAYKKIDELLSELPTQQAVALCNDMLLKIRDLNLLRKVANFLITNSSNPSQFENLRVGIEILLLINEKERTFFWNIINKPLLIIEQYLMNAKLDFLSKLLLKIKPLLATDIKGDNLFYDISLINSAIISVNSVDALLRIYAVISLDLKSTKIQRVAPLTNQPGDMFSQSIDSINLSGDNAPFTMPEEVPARKDWVPDNHTDRCMSCKTTIFSILIRRHHCRRCGRLVCYSCSQNKLQINGIYNDIKVRVCNDCHKQSTSLVDNAESNAHSFALLGSGSASSECPSMEWCLTADPKHNEELRKEFIYEFSPNVNLCLTIMKMHTINLDYPRFLLDRSSELATAAGTAGSHGLGGGSVRELLRMRRALLLCCVVLYSRPPPDAQPALADTALAHTERRLHATDALAALAQHNAHHIMPQHDTLDTHCVRRLLEAEKWELALEISTKFGLSRVGVLAAWGKACLKAGCYDEARKKFSLCFKNAPLNTSNQPTDDIDNTREPAQNKTILKLKKAELSLSGSQQDLSRGRTNQALLDEIVSLLENISYPLNSQIINKSDSIKSTLKKFSILPKSAKKVDTSEPTLNIMHALASLNKIKHGDYTDFSTTSYYLKKPKPSNILKKQSTQLEKFEFKPKLEAFFYNECIYYLTCYGSHGSIIEFYLKYDNMREALQYCCNQLVEKETFNDSIFMACLKSDKMDELLKMMNEMDSSWSMWTEYLLHICRVLEQKRCLEVLHRVQTGVGDHVRAAITCAGLYCQPTRPPHAAALHARAHHLNQARGHLQHVPRKLSHTDSPSSDASKLILHLKMDSASLDKHINTICTQLEISKFLFACEQDGRLKEALVKNIMPSISNAEEQKVASTCFLPTLFSSHSQKIKLAAIIIVCAETVEDGFPLSLRVIQDHQLDTSKVFTHVSRYLIDCERYVDVTILCKCIKNAYQSDSSISDGVIEVSVAAIVRRCDSKGQLFDELAELLIQEAEDISVKISCYIECRILKTAYILAVKHNRLGDLRRILREAERLGQTQVRNSCLKRLPNQKT